MVAPPTPRAVSNTIFIINDTGLLCIRKFLQSPFFTNLHGAPRCVVTNNAPLHFGRLSHFFDVVAADVPCSGEGMMRKDEQARRQWSPALVKQCADLQRSIIADLDGSERVEVQHISEAIGYRSEERRVGKEV